MNRNDFIVRQLQRDAATFSTISMEGSANLRACRSIENVSITNDTNLADFHRNWITTLTTP